MLYRGVRNGKRISEKVLYSPTLFVPSNKPSKYKTIYGKSVSPVKFETIKEAREFLETYKEVEGFQVWGNTYFNYCYLTDIFPEKIQYDPKLIYIANIDIETESENGFPEAKYANEPIICITIRTGTKYTTFGYQKFDTSKVNYNVDSRTFSDEAEMLRGFLKFWSSDYPDIITGFNTTTFDIPYLVNRITKVLGEQQARKLSPWGNFRETVTNFKGMIREAISLMGISTLDMQDLYLKYAPDNNQESYSLDNISKVVLGRGKLEYNKTYGSLQRLYKENYQLFREYNLVDVELVDLLEDKLKLIRLVLVMAFNAKINFDDALGKVKPWDNELFIDNRKHNIIVPLKKDNEKEEKIAGGFVRPIQSGLHRWVVSLDATSLYPSIEQQNNISPETLIPDFHINCTTEQLIERSVDLSEVKKRNYIFAGNGHCFKKDQVGTLPKIIKRMFAERQDYKKKKIDAEKQLELVKAELKKRNIDGGKG